MDRALVVALHKSPRNGDGCNYPFFSSLLVQHVINLRWYRAIFQTRFNAGSPSEVFVVAMWVQLALIDSYEETLEACVRAV